jgi:RNA polymerase sigma factor (sigma-70 family)
MEDIINTFTNTEKLTPEELSIILPRVKAGNADAIQRICEGYSRLIFKLSHRGISYRILGEDAENTAWMWFLEFVKTYDDDKFDEFPGLVRKYLIYKFVRLMQKQGTRWDRETKIDAYSNPNPFGGAEDDNLLDVLNSLALKQELKKLSPKQKLILNLYFSGRFNQREIAALCELSVRGVGYQKDLAIKRIRDKFCK